MSTQEVKKLAEECIIKYDDIKKENEENIAKYEEYIGMKKLREEQIILHRNTRGKKGRYWVTCKPQWELALKITGKTKRNTKYKIIYWVDYCDNNTYGYFTVEQIKEWFENKDIQLHEIGGNILK